MGQSPSRALPSKLSEPAVEVFGSSLRGKLISPADEGYESARRVFNGAIDRRPQLIAQCAGVADVIRSVNFARDQGLLAAIRGGGHSAPGFGTCDGGLVIDLSRMKGIRVDPVNRTVQVEGGCTWGDVDHATHVFGLATPGGIISSTGVAGLTLGGGFGYLTRRFGLACDNLIAADVVTADGRFVKASREENPDLFWALRGGGGNFGVVTSFEFRLHPVSAVYGGPVLYPLEQGAEVLRRFDAFMAEAPSELSGFFAYLIVPPGPPFPESLHLKTVTAIFSVWSGEIERGEQAIRGLREFGRPVFSFAQAFPYPVIQSLFDGLAAPGLHHYWKGDFVKSITEDQIREHVRFGPQVPTLETAIHIYPLDGAVHDVAADETAFAHRDVRFTHVIAAASRNADDLPRHREWAREYWAALHPHSAGGAYVNFLMEEGEERIAGSYRGNYARLANIKKKYDPDNLFRVNQNIRPAG